MRIRSGYVSLDTPERKDVRGFLKSSHVFRQLMAVPFSDLTEKNQDIVRLLGDATTNMEIEKALDGIELEKESLFGGVSLFVTANFDPNDNFKYYLRRLKVEFDAYIKAGEKVPLMARK